MKVWRQEDWLEAAGAAKSAESETSNESLRFTQDSVLCESEHLAEKPVDAEEAKKAREKAVYYLQFSGKTECELRKKLAENEFSPASVDSAIEYVKRYRYLDDEDYARRFVEKNGKKKSRRQMMYELTQKGVAREILDFVFDEMEVDEESQIIAILEKRGYQGDAATREEFQKVSAYLARKGFSYDAIQSALIQFARKTDD